MPAVVISESGGTANVDFPAKLTKQVVICSIIAAFGGLMFGYDIGISGKNSSRQHSRRDVNSTDRLFLLLFPSVNDFVFFSFFL